MPIDPNAEYVVSLSEAAKMLPRRRAGKRPHLSCVYRWTVNGCKGVILESIQIGGTRCTSREALARFFCRLSGIEPRPTEAQRSLAQRQRASEAAARELDRMGI